ncbi:MAG: chemotaxis protein CheW [Betaproteobacteria bacterium]|nr:chemotaxis protein CheW [Betaproteobacteria bacterium]
MNAAKPSFARTAADLRREFDCGFALKPATELEPFERFLAVRIAGDSYAIRAAHIGGLFAHRRIAPLPSPLSELLGVAGFRGQVAPVYDLAALLGYPVSDAPAWLVLARSPEPVALAFGAFEGQWLVSVQDVMTDSGNGGARSHVRGAVRTNGGMRPIVHLPSVLDEIRKQIGAIQSTKEA